MYIILYDLRIKVACHTKRIIYILGAPEIIKIFLQNAKPKRGPPFSALPTLPPTRVSGN